MPYKARKPCNYIGCTGLVEAGTKYCDKHKHLLNTNDNKQRRKLYDTQGWRRLRKYKLNQNPLCEHCSKDNKVVPAVHIDHIKPHKNNIQLFYDYSNLQSLCHSCHSKKTMKERKIKG